MLFTHESVLMSIKLEIGCTILNVDYVSPKQIMFPQSIGLELGRGLFKMWRIPHSYGMTGAFIKANENA